MPVKRSGKRFNLPGKAIRSVEEFYDEIARGLHFPEYFGRNLDALWDVLTTDIEGPVELVWEDSADSVRALRRARLMAIVRMAPQPSPASPARVADT